MKKLIVLVAALAIGLSATVEAKKVPAVAAQLPANLKQTITKQLEYPKEAVANKLEGDVWMKICVTDQSVVKIIDLSATNPKLGAYVKDELSSLYVDNPSCKTGQVFYLKVKFDLISKP
jgi:hypothetical protein